MKDKCKAPSTKSCFIVNNTYENVITRYLHVKWQATVKQNNKNNPSQKLKCLALMDSDSNCHVDWPFLSHFFFQTEFLRYKETEFLQGWDFFLPVFFSGGGGRGIPVIQQNPR